MSRYLIKKGEHYSQNRFLKLFLFKKKVKFLIDFDNSIIQYNDQEYNKSDINKIVGLCFWSFGAIWNSIKNVAPIHQYNSIRLGYVVRKGKLDLYAYWYRNGVRNYEYIDTVDAFGYLEVSFETVGNCVGVSIRGIKTGRNVSVYAYVNTSPISNMLFPYYGGDETAKQDFLINIDITS